MQRRAQERKSPKRRDRIKIYLRKIAIQNLKIINQMVPAHVKICVIDIVCVCVQYTQI